MNDERETFPDREELFSGPAKRILEQISLLKTYHGFDVLKEIEGYIEDRSDLEMGSRQVELVSEPLGDELDYFRYHFFKLFSQRKFNHIQRWNGATTEVSLSLTYNNASGPDSRKARKRDDNILTISAFPGLGMRIDNSRLVDTEYKLVRSEGILYSDLRLDPDSLINGAWKVFWDPPKQTR